MLDVTVAAFKVRFVLDVSTMHAVLTVLPVQFGLQARLRERCWVVFCLFFLLCVCIRFRVAVSFLCNIGALIARMGFVG